MNPNPRAPRCLPCNYTDPLQSHYHNPQSFNATPVSQPACLPVCACLSLPAYVPACLCLSACLSARLPACLCPSACLSVCLSPLYPLSPLSFFPSVHAFMAGPEWPLTGRPCPAPSCPAPQLACSQCNALCDLHPWLVQACPCTQTAVCQSDNLWLTDELCRFKFNPPGRGYTFHKGISAPSFTTLLAHQCNC